MGSSQGKQKEERSNLTSFEDEDYEDEGEDEEEEADNVEVADDKPGPLKSVKFKDELIVEELPARPTTPTLHTPTENDTEHDEDNEEEDEAVPVKAVDVKLPENDVLADLYGEDKLLEMRRAQFRKDLDSFEEIVNPEEYRRQVADRLAKPDKSSRYLVL